MVVTLLSGTRNDVKDRVASLVVTGGAVVVMAALLSTMVFVLARGWHALLHLNFFTEDMAGVGPRDSYAKGGILHAIVGSIIEIALALLVTIPLGIGTAVFMCEVGGRFASSDQKGTAREQLNEVGVSARPSDCDPHAGLPWGT